VLFRGQEFRLSRPYGNYVMENVLFKISFPAEFHAQTAVECAVRLHPQVCGRLDAIDRVIIRTHESALRIIDKKGPLHNPADRDHCLQYMVAVALIHGRLTAEAYEDDAAADPRIDALRARIEVERGAEVLGGLPGPGQAFDRQRAAGVLCRRQPDRRSGLRVPARALSATRRRHSGTGREVQEPSGAPLFSRAARSVSSRRRSTRRALEPWR
jgi:hypothetical protein